MTTNKLRFQSRKMVGVLEPFGHNTFIVRWDDREFRADAYVRFETNFDGSKILGAAMHHIDPDGGWNFDFQDFDFTRLDDSL